MSRAGRCTSPVARRPLRRSRGPAPRPRPRSPGASDGRRTMCRRAPSGARREPPDVPVAQPSLQAQTPSAGRRSGSRATRASLRSRWGRPGRSGSRRRRDNRSSRRSERRRAVMGCQCRPGVEPGAVPLVVQVAPAVPRVPHPVDGQVTDAGAQLVASAARPDPGTAIRCPSRVSVAAYAASPVRDARPVPGPTGRDGGGSRPPGRRRDPWSRGRTRSVRTAPPGE